LAGISTTIISSTAATGAAHDYHAVGIVDTPGFFLREAIESNRLERLLPDWSIPLGAVYWMTPPEGPLPKRVVVLGDYLMEKLARGGVAENRGRAASHKAVAR
jgi:DNA-binding transcriptional LysR family regulator